ncbi:restriction endonuclease subunit S [Microscilla marina]|uniref:Type I restriction modification DNA specificity domain-containing protein n=1 Tax=Microscilla marina ATCC 23134 TaxID=313606 RepID=A1ZTJ2_MICM2|nr:restriction endonuclease subunit S [Microscilla marina]EAY26252.1 conserved hypothetical protein [Microscilla marina ATCC 23134]
MEKVEKIPLGELFIIKSGATLTKRYTESAKARPMQVVKMKHIDHSLGKVDWGKVEAMALEIPNEDRLLHRSDLLFVAKGDRNTTIPLSNLSTDEYAVPSNHFFILRYKRDWKSRLHLEYVVWYLNEAAQGYFAQQGTGATVKNISMKVLENIEVPLPALQVQQKIAQTYALLQQEARDFEALQGVRKQILKGVLNKITGDETKQKN